MKDMEIRIEKVENGYEVTSYAFREGWKQRIVFGGFVRKEWVAKDREQLAILLKEIANSMEDLI